jgi:hypothetical protein
MQMCMALHQVVDFVFLYGAVPKAKVGFKYEAVQIWGKMEFAQEREEVLHGGDIGNDQISVYE